MMHFSEVRVIIGGDVGISEVRVVGISEVMATIGCSDVDAWHSCTIHSSGAIIERDVAGISEVRVVDDDVWHPFTIRSSEDNSIIGDVGIFFCRPHVI